MKRSDYINILNKSKEGLLLTAGSEQAVVLESLDLVIIRAHCFVDVVRVSDVFGSSLIIRVSFSFFEDFLSCKLVSLHHLNCENVVDFDVVSRDSVVQEVGWEHHVVSGVPELRVILSVEGHGVSGTDESETRHDQDGGPEVHEESGVVQGTLGNSENES